MLAVSFVMHFSHYCLFHFSEEARCRSAGHELSGFGDLWGHNMEGHSEMFSPDVERSESQLSIVELTKVTVCL